LSIFALKSLRKAREPLISEDAGLHFTPVAIQAQHFTCKGFPWIDRCFNMILSRKENGTMCGLLVVIRKKEDTKDNENYETFLDSLSRRGPDGYSFLQENNIWMGHTRLAIIDLSSDANQPFSSADKTHFLTFNGEIYNFREIRRSLENLGYRFRTESDTEVIITLYEEFGVEGFSQLRGMYAFVIYDKPNEVIIVARDRFGEKPLYVTDSARGMILSSQLLTNSAIAKNVELNVGAIYDYLFYQYIGPSGTVLRNTRKFPPNTVETYNLSGKLMSTNKIYPESAKVANSPDKSLKKLLEEAVEKNLVSDVPVSIAQSGGLDSVAIAIMASKVSRMPLHSFTVGYEGEYDFDERPWATKISNYLGTTQHNIRITCEEFVSDFDEYVSSLQDPIADPAGYSQFRLAKEINTAGFKVCLTGLGADELFWGYSWLAEAVEKNEFKLIGKSHAKSTSTVYERFYSFAYKIFKNHLDIIRERPHKLDQERLYFYSSSNEFNSAFSLSRKYINHGLAKEYDPFAMSGFKDKTGIPIPVQIQEKLFETWLSCNSLSLIDQVSMYHSVEFRNPFLDSDLADYATKRTKVDIDSCLFKGEFKKEIQTIMPKEFFDRPKSGFNFPSNSWFRVLLEAKSERLLDGSLVKLEIVNMRNLEKSLSQIEKLSWQHVNFLYKLVVLDTYLQRFN
jgi:asparagine synthase (glutamine-hydrolysing)